MFVSLEDIKTVLDRNLMSCIQVCRQVAPEMIERRAGRIVNFGSTGGTAGHTTEVIYATAKAAVAEYSRCLAAQLRPYDVTVNVVAQGDTDEIGCRITVNGVVKDERSATGVNAQTFCLVKAA